MSKLIGMGFVLQMDREIDPEKHYISPGGFELNGKRFDFFSSIGNRVNGDDSKIEFWMEEFDENYANANQEEPITEDDCENGTFGDFYVYTGEAAEGDEVCNVLSVSDLFFQFDNGKEIFLKNDSPTVKSANACIEQLMEAEGGLIRE